MKRIKHIMMLAVFSTAIAGCTTVVNTPLPSDADAVLIGLGYKCDKKELQRRGTELDIESIEELIRTSYGKAVKNEDGTMTYYIGKNSEIVKHHVLKDNHATVFNVKNAIRNALKKELAIIYFSCKAKQIPTNDPTEADGMDEALMLYDGVLLDNEIWDILKDAKGRVFLVFDTSYAASMFKAASADETPVESITDGLLNEEAPGLNMVCWAACNEDETVAERSIGSKMTNTFYFKENPWFSYDMVFRRMQKSLDGKQNIKKIVVGEDFSNRTIFR